MHTPLCGHAIGLPEEYVSVAAARNIELVTFTCHIPMNAEYFGGPRIRMSEAQLPDYFELVQRARDRGRELGVEVLCGIEAEIFPDDDIMADMDKTLSRQPFDFVLGSLHHQISRYQMLLDELGLIDDASIIDAYFKQLCEGAASGRYDSIAHPDVIRIYGTVEHFEPREHEVVIRDFLQTTIDNDICIEVNTSGLIKGVHELHPDPLILTWAHEMGAKLTIGSDSHQPSSVGQKYNYVLPLLKAIGFEKLHYHRNRKRIEISIQDALAVVLR